jgi:hypothetical protein
MPLLTSGAPKNRAGFLNSSSQTNLNLQKLTDAIFFPNPGAAVEMSRKNFGADENEVELGPVLLN